MATHSVILAWRIPWTKEPGCEELTHWKRLWCWERLGAGGEGDDRGWDGWMASLTQWTWVWVNSGSWWCTRRPGMLRFVGSQRVGHDWATELNWTELNWNWVLVVLVHAACTWGSTNWVTWLSHLSLPPILWQTLSALCITISKKSSRDSYL